MVVPLEVFVAVVWSLEEDLYASMWTCCDATRCDRHVVATVCKEKMWDRVTFSLFRMVLCLNLFL